MADNDNPEYDTRALRYFALPQKIDLVGKLTYRVTTLMKGGKPSSSPNIHEMHYKCDRPAVLQSLLYTVTFAMSKNLRRGQISPLLADSAMLKRNRGRRTTTTRERKLSVHSRWCSWDHRHDKHNPLAEQECHTHETSKEPVTWELTFAKNHTLDQSCRPRCKDDPGFLNRLISLPEARDIPIATHCAPEINFLSVGPLIKVVDLDEADYGDSAHQINILYCRTLHQSCSTMIAVDSAPQINFLSVGPFIKVVVLLRQILPSNQFSVGGPFIKVIAADSAPQINFLSLRPFIKVVVLYVKMPGFLNRLICYQKHVLSPFQDCDRFYHSNKFSVVRNLHQSCSPIADDYAPQINFLSVGPFIKVVVLWTPHQSCSPIGKDDPGFLNRALLQQEERDNFTLHQSCSPGCKDDPGFLNRTILLPEARVIPIAADSTPQIIFSIGRNLHQSCSPICKDDPGFLNRTISIADDSAPEINFLLVGPFIKVVVLDIAANSALNNFRGPSSSCIPIAADSAPQINFLSVGPFIKVLVLSTRYPYLKVYLRLFFYEADCGRFYPSNQFSVGRTLHQSSSPVCKDDPGFLNHLILLPEARDIPI
uniref:Uncharacterized protein n=1 Tax=Salix viminalis TaxID=40686 RepID=A0A6N2KDC1_SALVM